MKSSNRIPVILVGVLLFAFVVAALLLVRDTRPSGAAPPEVARVRPGSSSEEPSPAEIVQPAAATERRAEEESPDSASHAASAADAAAFHGRVVDVATGEPVAFARLVAGTLEATVDGEGHWQCAAPLPDHVDQVEFQSLVNGTHIRTVRRDDLEEDQDRWLARIAIGPTYRLHIVDASLTPAKRWHARLVEIAESGRETRGAWIELFPPPAGELPFLRYDNPWEPDAPGSAFRVDVRDDTATRRGSSIMIRPENSSFSSRKIGTRVVLPAPGGACKTAIPCPRMAVNNSGKTASTGNIVIFAPRRRSTRRDRHSSDARMRLEFSNPHHAVVIWLKYQC